MHPLTRNAATVPNIQELPDDALLTRKHIMALTGFALPTLKKWAREGRGPRITYVEGRPRTKVRDFRAWIDGSPASALD